MEIKHTIDLDANVKMVKNIGDGKIFVSDINNVFQIIDCANDYKVLQKNKIGTLLKEHQDLSNLNDVSTGGQYLSINDRTQKNVKVYNFLEKKALFVIDWHLGQVESVAFDFQNNYIATGGQDGKTFIWSLKTGKLAYTLPRHPDFVTTVCFSKNGSWIATGSYDKRIRVTNINSANKSVELIGRHKGYVKFIYFISKNRLVSVDHWGTIVVWNYVTGEFIKEFPSMDIEPMALTFIYDFKFMIVAARNKNAYLYDMHSYKLITKNFFSVLEGITDFANLFHQNLLIIGTENSQLIAFDMKSDERDLKRYIAEENYLEAYAVVNKNPTLYSSQEYLKLESIWDDTCHKAYELLHNLETEQAKKIFAPFFKIPSKNSFINSTINDFKEFSNFVQYVNNRKFALAYGLASKYQVYKTSKEYKNMEAIWNTQMAKVKMVISKDMANPDEMIDKLLQEFKGIPAKSKFIGEMKEQKLIVKIFRDKLNKKDFSACYQLIDKYHFLKEMEEYDKLSNIERLLYKKTQEILPTSNYTKLKIYLDQLSGFPNYKNEVTQMYHDMQYTMKFFTSYAQKDYDTMLKIVNEAPFLEDSAEFIKFNEQWKTQLNLAELYVAKGNIKGILASIGKFKNIGARVDKIGYVISTAYIQQLSLIAKKYTEKRSLILKCINQYINIFGVDDNILAFLDYLKNVYAIEYTETQLQTTLPSYSRWVKMELPEKIFE